MSIQNYIVQKDLDKSVLFDGSYTKYLSNTPYCAVFKTYPAASTDILILKQISDTASDSQLCCHLFSRGLDAEIQRIGRYIPIKFVHTEKEVLSFVKAESNGISDLLNAIKPH